MVFRGAWFCSAPGDCSRIGSRPSLPWKGLLPRFGRDWDRAPLATRSGDPKRNSSRRWTTSDLDSRPVAISSFLGWAGWLTTLAHGMSPDEKGCQMEEPKLHLQKPARALKGRGWMFPTPLAFISPNFDLDYFSWILGFDWISTNHVSTNSTSGWFIPVCSRLLIYFSYPN